MGPVGCCSTPPVRRVCEFYRSIFKEALRSKGERLTQREKREKREKGTVTFSASYCFPCGYRISLNDWFHGAGERGSHLVSSGGSVGHHSDSPCLERRGVPREERGQSPRLGVRVSKAAGLTGNG